MAEISATRTWRGRAARLREHGSGRTRGRRSSGANRLWRLLLMPSAWRIVRAARIKTAFTGEGSRLYGGRWNSRGTSVVYVSEHESLAALELFVHTMPVSPIERYFSFRLEWDDRLTEYFPAKNLPPGWDAEPPMSASMRIGDEWARRASSVALALPSLLSTSELNFLLNPNHPDFKRIKINGPIEYHFDPRMARR
jgi:RES domain-containing protein